ncbi:MAG: alanine racemase, partial [Alphaproteobacteria bacterium]|nr:alanine racemase [Alphaproteobacteria bacterium]
MPANKPELPAATISDLGHADSIITISPQAVVANWRYLASLSSPTTETAAVVKADGYGLGASQLAPHLADAGCRTFFVMSLDEAITLRGALRDSGHDSCAVLILGGCHPGQEDEMLAHDITPVINTREQLERLGKMARQRGAKIAAALHV